MAWAPNTRGRHVNKKARSRPLAGVKGYSFETPKRFMKGGGDVGTTTCKWDKFPQVSVKESPFHTGIHYKYFHLVGLEERVAPTNRFTPRELKSQ